MNLLKRLKLGQRLALMVLVPLLVMIGFAVNQSLASFSLLQTTVQMQSMSELSVDISNLVHELQKERGMTAGFIGSAGKQFGTQLRAQRQETSTKLTVLQQFLDDFDSSSLGSEFDKDLKYALDRLTILDEQRKAVDSLDINLKNALAYYTGNNTALLLLISEMSTLSPEKELAIMTAAYANYLQGKERAGIERAVLANAFARDQFSDGLFQKFMSLVTVQDTYRSVFLSLATPENKAFFKDTVQGNFIDETGRMRNVAIEKADTGGFGIDPVYWFRMQTGKINLLKQVEDNLAASLQLKADDLKTEAVTELWVSISIALLGVLVSAGLGILIGRGILVQLGGEPTHIEKIASNIANGYLDIDPEHHERDPTGVYAAMLTMRQRLSEVIETDIQSIVISASEGDLSRRVSLEGKQGFYEKLSTGVNELLSISESVIDDTVRVFGALARGDLNESIDREYQGSFNQLGQDANATIKKIKEVIEGDIQSLVDAARSGELDQRIDLAEQRGFFKSLSSGINELVGSVDGFFNDIAGAMHYMAQGDLTKPIGNEYLGSFNDIKLDINKTITNLEGTVSRMRESGDVITTVADEISLGNNNLSARTEQQASALEQTASSMEELTSIVASNADNAQEASQLAVSTRMGAEKGGEVVSRAVQAMDEINTSSSKIEEIIGVIDDIAFQTNLLALNASVEAARAGEQGRGFAVVATEVRNLAGRSATAAKEIKELIQDSVEKVRVGSKLVQESGETLDGIVVSIRKVVDIVSEIAAASREQSAGIGQVNQAVSSLDEMTQQNAALAEQTSAAATSMSEKAREMNQMMSFFHVSVNRTGAAVVRPGTQSTTPSITTAHGQAAQPVYKPASTVADKHAQTNDADDWEEF